MPNWCTNLIQLNGSKEDMGAFEHSLGSSHVGYAEQALKIAMAGVAGVLKSIKVIDNLPHPFDGAQQVTSNLSRENIAYTEFLEMLHDRDELMGGKLENNNKFIDIYERTNLKNTNWGSIPRTQRKIMISYLKNTMDRGHSVQINTWWASTGLDNKLQHTSEAIFDFNNYVSVPLINLIRPYDIKVKERLWGTKWNMMKPIRSDSLDNIYISTAWSPCIEVIQALALRFNLSGEHAYWEEGNDLSGFVEYVEGVAEDSCEGCIEYGEEDEDGCSEIIGPEYLLKHIASL